MPKKSVQIVESMVPLIRAGKALENPKVHNAAIDSFKWWYTIRIFLTIAIVVYILSIVIKHFASQDTVYQSSLEFTHTVLFGHSGALTFILYMWLFTAIFVIFFPVAKEFVEAMSHSTVTAKDLAPFMNQIS